MEQCRPCPKLTRTVAIAATVLLVVAIVYYAARYRRRDSFVSHEAQEMYHKSRELFERTGGKVTYSEYKTALQNADVVVFTDILNLWKGGRLSPEEVEKVL